MASDPTDPRTLAERRRIGTIIRSLRDWRDLRQEPLAELSGVSISTIKRIEAGSGNCRIEHYIRLAHALNVPTAWIFRDDWHQLVEQQAHASTRGTDPTA